MSNENPLWIPSEERIHTSNLQQFIQHINMQGEAVETYQQLHQWSVADKKKFWLEIWQFCDVIGFCGNCIYGEGIARWQQFLPARDTIWFPQAQLNYAENLLSYAFQKPEGIAIWFKNESGQTKKLSWQQLSDQVSVVQQWLTQNGVMKGDVVAACLPHMPETVVAMLATTSLGAIWASSSPSDDVTETIAKFEQIQPKILFCCNGYSFNGSNHLMEEHNSKIVQSIESIENTCQIEYLQQREYSVNFNDTFSDWQSLLSSYLPRGLTYERIGFNDPLFVLFSDETSFSNTKTVVGDHQPTTAEPTPPRCITHSVGGTVLNHLKEHQLHCDIQPDERILVNTECDSMMWNWHISALASGATLVIFDGCPFYPQLSSLWELIQEAEVTLLATPASYLQTLEKKAFAPGNFYSLASLKTLCSTGEMLDAEQFDYIYDQVKPDLHLSAMSADSTILGNFVIGNPISPVYSGECQGAALGLDIDVIGTDGQPVSFDVGELVCKNSFPNQPIGFWHDDGEQYHLAFWNNNDGFWHQSSQVERTRHGGIRCYGLNKS